MTHTKRLNKWGRRVIDLEGTYNFRDMGGYASDDGRVVKYGLLFRSDQLDELTEQDLLVVQQLKVDTILDYRDEDEAARNPTPRLQGTHYRRMTASPLAKATNPNAGKDALRRVLDRGTMIELYQKLPFSNFAYQFLLETMENSDRMSILHHCAGGKDRTGVGALLILKLLGVSDAIIMEDYLLTNETLAPRTELWLEQYSADLEPERLQSVKEMFLASEDYLNAAISAIIEAYGSWDEYFKQEFGLTVDKRSRIRNRYLE
jgi:protein-tyrosine phosphatase